MSNIIRIISTSDVHGKILPHSYADGHELNIGFAKLATVIEKLRTENTILIDNGDTLDGSPLQSFYYKKIRDNDDKLVHYTAENELPDVEARDGDECGSPVSMAMSIMGYDYINIGNHDFDYGMEELKKHIDCTGAKCINLNVGYEYDIKELAGVRIAVFGVLTHFTKMWESEDKLGNAILTDAFTLAAKTVERIKREANPDYIICCYHGGLEKDPQTGKTLAKDDGENQGYRMLSEIEGLDVVIMGHQHTLSAGLYNGKAYSQAGVDGSHLSVIDIDTESVEVDARLVSLEDERIAPSKEIEAALAGEEMNCQKWLDMPIGKSKIDLRVRNEEDARLNKSQFTTFINKVQMERLDGELTSSSLFLGATGLGETITMRDLVSSYAFPNTLVKKRISGRVLREYLEKTLEFWDVEDDRIVIARDYLEPIPQHFNYDILDGVEYEAHISKPRGERLISLTRGGRPIEDDDEFSIVLNNYRAAGGGDYPMLSALETLDVDLTNMVDVLAEYIEKNGEIEFEPVYNISIKIR